MTLVRGDWFYVLLVFIDAFFMTRPYLYAIQQDNYRISEIFKNRRLKFVYLIDLCAVALFISVWCIFYFLQTRAFWGFLTVLFFFIAEFAMYFMEDLPTRKKPLRYTKRAVRFLFLMTVLSTTVIILAFAVGNAYITQPYMRYLVLFGFPIVYPLIFMTFGAVINVFERINNKRYERRTVRLLDANPNLIRIAITGSFGKTSVKNFLAAILSEKYNVLVTPASYNTPMGISKTVNGLDGTHDVFIAEFGARRVGDIRTLMRIVKPDYTILTGINSQHLETFRTQENITREKCRILRVGEEGFCVVNSTVRKDAEESINNLKKKPTIVYSGIDEKCDFRAEQIRTTENGSDFDIILDGESHYVRTPLIGYPNIEDILLAATMAYKLGVEVPFILDAIEKLEPVPHRMQLVHGNGIKIIDDSFNSNPDGARTALETLGLFEGRRVILTPGLVELGERESEENYKLGTLMSEVADLVLLVGLKRTDPIRRGLVDGGYGGEIHIYNSLSDAEDDFSNRLHVGDILLILNDLPDIYNEKK